MDYIIHEERYALETFSSHTQYLHNQPQENNFDVESMADEDVDVCMKEGLSKRVYTLYRDQDKVRFFKVVFEKVRLKRREVEDEVEVEVEVEG